MINKNKSRRSARYGEKGNVFFTLFGAVAIVGVLGAGIMATMRGPLTTMVNVNNITQAEAQMQIAAKLAMLEAVSQAASGDCDSDQFVEPIEYQTNIAGLTGGGTLPASIGSNRQDPWGTDYGYCAWDAGTVNTLCGGGSPTLLAGDGTIAENYSMLVIISAGSDRVFQTTCATIATTGLTKGGDDLVMDYSYETASASIDGLWKIKSGDPDAADIQKNIDLTSAVPALGGASPQLRLGAASMLFPTQADLITCNGANHLLLRVNTGTPIPALEICDNPNWESVAAGSSLSPWIPGTGDDIYYMSGTSQVGIGNNSPTEALDVTGNIQMSLDAMIGRDAIVGRDLYLLAGESIIWDAAGSPSTITENATAIQIDANGGALELTVDQDAVDILGDTTIQGTTTDNSANALEIFDSTPTSIFVIENDGDVGIGDPAPGDALDVVGVIDSTEYYKIDGANVLMSDGTMPSSIMVGKDAGGALSGTPTTGDYNTILGAGAAATLTTGTDNIIIGSGLTPPDVAAAGTSNYLSIGDLIYGDLANGRVGIGTNTLPDDALEVAGKIDATGDIEGTDLIATGDMYVNTSDKLTPAVCASDKKLQWTIGGGAVAWTCVDDEGGGTGAGGSVTLFDVLTADNDATGAPGILDLASLDLDGDADIFGNVGIGVAASLTDELTVNGVTNSDDFEASAGAAATPSYAFTTNSTTGLFLPAAGSLGLTTGGTEAMRIVGSNISIGSDFVPDSGTGGQLALDIEGNAGAIAFCDENGDDCFTAGAIAGGGGGLWTAGAGDDIYYDSGVNHVGIGLTNPTMPLEVVGRVSFSSGSNVFITGGNNTTTGINSVAIGVGAGISLTSGGSNTFVGQQAGLSTQDGANNTFIGRNTGVNNISGASNTFIGEDAGAANIAGANNTFVGENAGLANTASGNTFIGQDSGLANIGGINNTTLGENAMLANVAGSNNTVLGNGAGAILDGGDNNILIGKNADTLLAGTDEYLNIGDLLLGDLGATSLDPRIGTFKYCDENLATCFTAADIAGGTTGAPGNDREIIYNSGDVLGTDVNFVFTSAGQMGIGTAGPAAQLHIHHATDAAQNITSDADIGTGGTSLLTFTLDADGTPNNAGIGMSNNGQLRLSGENAVHMVIDDNGEVGIGTTNPEAALDVAGTDAILFPRGDGTNRPIPAVDGMMRYNTVTDKYEAFQGGFWNDIITSGAGGITFLDLNDTPIDYTGVALDFLRINAGETGLEYVSASAFDDQNLEDVLTIGNDANTLTALNLGGVAVGSAVLSAGAETLELDVTGDIGATNYCDADGNFCFIASDVSGGAAGLWTAGTGDIIHYDSGTPLVGIGLINPDDTLDVVGTAQITQATVLGDTLDVAGIATFSDDAQLKDGSAADPSLVFTNSATTGLFRAAADSIGIATAGTEKMRITSAGQLVLGDTAASIGLQTLELDVEGDIGAINYCDELGNDCFTAGSIAGGGGGLWTAGTGDIIHYDSGTPLVGIGLINPDDTLDVVGTAQITQATVLGDTLDVAGIATFSDDAQLKDGSAADPSLVFTNSATTGLFRAAADSIGIATAGTEKMRITSAGQLVLGDTAASIGLQTLELDVEGDIGAINYCDELGNDCFTAGSIAGGGGGLWTAGTGDIIHYDSGTPLVGIGLINPDDTLDVVGTAQITQATVLGDTLDVAGIATFSDDAQLKDGSAADPSLVFTNSATTGLFRAAADSIGIATAGTEKMRITPAGQLVLGDTAASIGLQTLELDVEGDIGAINYCDELGNDCFTAGSIAGGGGGLWTAGTGDIIHYNSGTPLVGIGTITPTETLYVSGTGHVTGTTTLGDTLGVTGATTLSDTLGVTGIATFSEDAQLKDGSAADPSLVFTNSATTGLFRAAADSIGIATAGTEKMRITPAGQLVLGDTAASIGLQTLELDVEGDIGAINYCDELGNDCFTAGSIAGGGGGLWTDDTTHISYESVRIIKEGQGIPAGLGGDGGLLWYASARALLGGSDNTWSDANIGRSSIAFGRWDTYARGASSAAFGATARAIGDTSVALNWQTQAIGQASLATGRFTDAVGEYSTAMGHEVDVTGDASFGIGLNNVAGVDPIVSGAGSFGLFMGDQGGVDFSSANTMGIFGGPVIVDPAQPATQFAPSGTLAFDVEGDIGAIQYCDELGGNCFTAGSIAGGGGGLWTAGAGDDIYYNSGTPQVGIGTATPTANLHVSAGTAGDAVLILEADTDDNDENDNPAILLRQDGGSNTVSFLRIEGDAAVYSADTLDNATLLGNNGQALQLLTTDLVRMTVLNTGNIGIGTNTPAAALDVFGTDAILFPRGVDGNRPGGVNGMMRYNTASGKFEAFQGGFWLDIITSGAGGVAINDLSDAATNYTSSNMFLGNNSGAGIAAGLGNVALGPDALAANTDGNNNTAMGINALLVNTTGGSNTAYGMDTLRSNTIGDNNTAVGVQALRVNLDGLRNTALGALAGDSVTTGDDNILIGYNVDTSAPGASNEINIGDKITGDMTAAGVISIAGTGALGLPVGNNTRPTGAAGLLRYNTVPATNDVVEFYDAESGTWLSLLSSGGAIGAINDLTDAITNYASNNMFLGQGAGASITTGVDNVTLGENAGNAMTIGNQNTFMGSAAGSSNTQGLSNSFFGYNAGASNTTGNENTFIGQNTGNATTSDWNTFIGSQAGSTNISGDDNVYLGYEAGRYSTTGAENVLIGADTADNASFNGFRNTFVGSQVGAAVTTGDDNILIGYNVATSAAGADNELNIGDVITGEMDTGEIVIAGTRALTVPIGTTAQQPSNDTSTDVDGMMRYNTSDSKFEFYENNAWVNLGGAAGAIDIDDLGDAATNYTSNNMFLGQNSGNATNKGINNVALGENALAALDGTCAVGIECESNTAVGYNALTSNTTGAWNTATGYRTMEANLTGQMNTAYGLVALLSNTSGNWNTAVGVESLNLNTTGDGNTALGRFAMEQNVLADDSAALGYAALRYFVPGAGSAYNVAIGPSAMLGNVDAVSSTGVRNTALGAFAGQNLESGDDNVFVGHLSGENVTTASKNVYMGFSAGSGDGVTAPDGDFNVGIGADTMVNITTATRNTAVGDGVLGFTTTGNRNAAFGRHAMYRNVDGAYNTALGYMAGNGNVPGSSPEDSVFVGAWSGFNITTGVNNAFMGYRAGYLNTTGANNIFLGHQAGEATTTGSNNIVIGYDIDTSAAGVSNELNIGDLITGDLSAGGVTYISSTGAFRLPLGDDSERPAAEAGLLRYNTQKTPNDVVEYYDAETGGWLSLLSSGGAGASAINDLTDAATDYTSGNVFLGQTAGGSSTGNSNTAVGQNAGRVLTTATANTLMGQDAGYNLTTGDSNTLIGVSAGSVTSDGIENVAMGHMAGQWLDDGANYNTLIGTKAGQSLTGNSLTGDNNTALGARAGRQLTTGTDNVFVGLDAGNNNTTGIENVAIGVGAAYTAASGTRNVSIGHNAATLATDTAVDNVIIGHNAGDAALTAANNVFIGKNAGSATTSGNANTFIGTNSGNANLGGPNNVFLGYEAGVTNTSGAQNTFIGMNAGKDHDTGTYNTFLGYNTGENVIAGDYNTFLGESAGWRATGGNRNTLVGRTAGDNLLTGSDNIGIGFNVNFSGGAVTNELNIGNTILGDLTQTGVIYISNSGAFNVSVGTTGERPGTGTDGMFRFNTTADAYEVYSTTLPGWVEIVSAGGIHAGGGASAINDLSDAATNYTSNNIFLGQGAGNATTAGLGNIGLGINSLDALASTCGAGPECSGNIAIGANAGTDINTGRFNSMFGDSAGFQISTGNHNTYLGASAGFSTTGGIDNTAVGYRAGYGVVGGSQNVHVGIDAGHFADGIGNVMIGDDAGQGVVGLTNVSNNVLIGNNAAMNILTLADTNTIIGANTAGTLTTGASNILIGNAVDVPLAATSDYLNIGNLIYGDLANKEIFLPAPLAAVADGDLAVNQVTIYLAEGTDDIIIKAKESGGTILTKTLGAGGANAINDLSDAATNYTSNNMFLGQGAGAAITSGADNVALGENALFDLTEGTANIAIGLSAGSNLTTGIENIFIGRSSGGGATNNQFNTVMGTQAGQYLDAGADRNSLIGTYAGQSLGATSLTGDDNTVMGYAAGRNLSTGADNTFVGKDAGKDVTTGTNNVIIGKNAGEAITITSNTVLVGTNAGLLMTGGNNTVLGGLAGDAITTGTDNILLGYNVDTSAAGASNELNIGNLITGDLSAGGVTYISSTGAFRLPLGDDSERPAAEAGLLRYNTQKTPNDVVEYYDAETGGWLSLLSSGGAGATSIDELSDAATNYTSQSMFLGQNSGTMNTGDDNTALGKDALENNTTGIQNTAVGGDALNANVDGDENTAMGFEALEANTSGTRNTAFGDAALRANTIGNDNVAVGKSALDFNTGGDFNTALGNRALLNNTVADYSAAVGNDALRYFVPGVGNAYNVAIGPSALMGNVDAVSSTGVRNTALGGLAGQNLESGNDNVFLGYNAGNAMTTNDGAVLIGAEAGVVNTAAYSVFIGWHSGMANIAGTSNTFVGVGAGFKNVGGNSNSYFGSSAGENTLGNGNAYFGAVAGKNSTGSNNTFFGAGVGYGPLGVGATTTGTDNILIGKDVIASAPGASFELNIGDLITGDLSAGGVTYISSTGAFRLPLGDDSEQPAGQAGLIRYNTQKTPNDVVEYYDAETGGWLSLLSSGGAGASAINDLTDASTDYTSDSMYLGLGSGAVATGLSNTLLGVRTGNLMATGDYNTYVGYEAGKKTTASRNVFMGYRAGEATGISGDNVIIGFRAADNAGGTDSLNGTVLIGGTAGETAPQIDNSVVIGFGAGEFAEVNDSLFLGLWAGRNATGDNNIFLGREAGSLATSGDSNILIGNSVQKSVITAANELNIGNLIYGDLANNEVFLDAPAAAAPDGDLANGQVTFWVDATTDEINLKAKDSAGDLINVTVGAGGANAINDLSDAATNYTSNNIFLGQGAGNATLTGDDNTTLGVNTGLLLTTGSNNTFIGLLAGSSQLVGRDNVFVGKQAGQSATGNGSVFIGKQAGKSVTSATGNTAVGGWALATNVSGVDNTAIGDNALSSATGASNTALGAQAGDLATGNNNTFMGADAGALATSGNNNILIGQGVEKSVITASDELNIGNTIYADLSTDRVGIGALPAAGIALDVTGDIQMSGRFHDISDIRLKKDITALDRRAMLDKLDDIGIYSFRMIDGDDALELGVIAQEMEKVFPELVRTGEDEMGTKSVNYLGLIAPLIGASQELKAENEALKAEIAGIKTERADIFAAINDIRTSNEKLAKEVHALKAHTGYGVNKASMGGTMVIAMITAFGSVAIFFVAGGMIRRRRKEEA